MKNSEFHDLSELSLNSDGQSWGNLGYWSDGIDCYSAACQALALKLGEAAGLNRESVIFDAGFGCGDQLQLWLEHFCAADICGINISDSQTKRAKTLLTKIGQSKKSNGIIKANIDHPSQWHTVIGDRSISHCIALDCAYHFPSRRNFISYAQSHLRSDGTLALTDFILLEENLSNTTDKLLFATMLMLSRIPRRNMIGKSDYKRELEDNDFHPIEIYNISQPVMDGFSDWIESGKAKQAPLLSRLKYRVTGAFLRWAYNRSILQYAIIVAEKNH